MQERARVWGLLVLIAAILVGCTASQPASLEVRVYGDSFAREAQEAILRRVAAALPGSNVEAATFAGAAQCDFHERMEHDALEDPMPDLVLIAFVGNSRTPCMTSRMGDRSVEDLYREDAHDMVEFWEGHEVPVAFIGAPPLVPGSPVEGLTPAVPEVYREVAAATGSVFVSAERLFVDPVTGSAAMRLGCLPGDSAAHDCDGGRVQVRSDDGAHLCTALPEGPVPFGGWSCAGYSSGAERYASAFAEAAVAAAPREARAERFEKLPDATSARWSAAPRS